MIFWYLRTIQTSCDFHVQRSHVVVCIETSVGCHFVTNLKQFGTNTFLLESTQIVIIRLHEYQFLGSCIPSIGRCFIETYEFMELFQIDILMRTRILKVHLQMKQCIWFCFPISSFFSFSFDISWRHPIRIIEQKQNIVDQVDCLCEQTVVVFRDRLFGCHYMVCLIAARLSFTWKIFSK